jgi:L-threonylcarbamoyladenylate synthase
LSKKISSNQVQKAVEHLRAGQAVVFPTDTAYGLAVDALNPKAVEHLYRLKGREKRKPVHVIFPDLKMANKHVFVSPLAKKIFKHFFPGKVTLVLTLKKKTGALYILSAGTGKLGVRMPKQGVAINLAKEFGRPITATSANISKQPLCYSVPAVKKQFIKKQLKPDYYLHAGKLKPVLPTTVIGIKAGKLVIYRQGPILPETIIKKIK